MHDLTQSMIHCKAMQWRSFKLGKCDLTSDFKLELLPHQAQQGSLG
jgi:hypothetical protein